MDTHATIVARSNASLRAGYALGLANMLHRPIQYMDIGCCWGIENDVLNQLVHAGKCEVTGFEPFKEEFDRLQPAKGFTYINAAVGMPWMNTLNITSHPAQSSFYEPDLDALLPGPRRESARVIERRPCQAVTLEELINSGKVRLPDYLKIDAQGAEFDILSSAGPLLKSVFGIRCELHLRPLYKGQHTFTSVYELMRGMGFVLRDLRTMPPEQHECVEIEAYFSQRDTANPIARIWEVAHEIPPGRILTEGGQWVSLL